MHPINQFTHFAEVILPLGVKATFTYGIPQKLLDAVAIGKRVEVSFGKETRGKGLNLYAGIVMEVREGKMVEGIKPIISILDALPIVNLEHLHFWKWMSDYYGCSLGSVMNAALPAHFKLTGETSLVLGEQVQIEVDTFTDQEYLIIEALSIRQEVTIEEVQQILQQTTVFQVIRGLLDKQVVYLKTDLKERYRAKRVKYIQLQEPYASQPRLLEEAFESVARSGRQTEALMAYVLLAKEQQLITQAELSKKAGVDGSVFKAMEKKGILEVVDKEVSRLDEGVVVIDEPMNEMSEAQKNAYQAIVKAAKEKRVCLLHGVTGSGKTRIYIELIQQALNRGEQVLYLLPEIALTTQLTARLKKVFGTAIGVYHSRMSNNERVELWKQVLDGLSIVIGPRSAVFLPYGKLRLIIVDEEHEASFKQMEPAPRYQGRDAAVYLANLMGAQVILGTATPSVESYYNALTGKYGLVTLEERYGGIRMPDIQVIDARKELRQTNYRSNFTTTLLAGIQKALEQKEQVILFQNRRGYAPTYRCENCGWNAECVHCDVSLTYHKYSNQLKCHYCGYHTKLPKGCQSCGHPGLKLVGFGTEKIEDELLIHFPDARVGRMDLETVRKKNAHGMIIQSFEEGKIDILVGTQMVTKGLDFENVGLVGVISADQLLQYPDFRASERGFQLMLQVAGRAGRQKPGGQVLIQAFSPNHPVIGEVVQYNYTGFYEREIKERKAFGYPPFQRLIQLTLKHKKPEKVNQSAEFLAKFLRSSLGNRVQGPAIPFVGRVKSYYLLDIWLKLERGGSYLSRVKELIQDGVAATIQLEGCSQIKIVVDVDPY